MPRQGKESETSRTDLLPSAVRKIGPVRQTFNNSAFIQNHSALITTKVKFAFIEGRKKD